jgi:hypothetical protein
MATTLIMDVTVAAVVENRSRNHPVEVKVAVAVARQNLPKARRAVAANEERNV